MKDVPAEDAKAGNDAIRANRARQLKNFNYVVRRTAWLFCSPLSEHLRLDAKREKKLKPTAVKSRKMLVERVPHWQMLISVRYRKIERVAAGHGHFCMVSGVMDKFKEDSASSDEGGEEDPAEGSNVENLGIAQVYFHSATARYQIVVASNYNHAISPSRSFR